MALGFEYSLFPPKIHCIMSSTTNTPNNGNAPLFFSGDLKFDTGADITCISASRLNLHSTEEEFTKWMQQNENVEIIKNGQIKWKKRSHHLLSVLTSKDGTVIFIL